MNEKNVKIVKALNCQNRINIFRVINFDNKSGWFILSSYEDFKDNSCKNQIKIHKSNVVLCEGLNG